MKAVSFQPVNSVYATPRARQISTVRYAAASPPPQATRKAPAEDGFFKSLGENTMNGVKRTMSKTFLRPRGWLELIVTILSHGMIPFPVKHFVEGFFGVDSIFFKRQLGKKEHDGLTLFEKLKQKINP